MKKTVQVNLSGQIFTLDDDAYEMLANYLHQIGKMYDRSPGKDEIIHDIEARIAELLLERMTDGKQVVSLKDVEAVISIMGRPEQFETDDEYQEYTSQSSSNTSSSQSKRLYRDSENTLVGGVCAGFGHYFGIDPVWIRLIFAAAVIFGGTGVLLYIILWVIIPTAKTTAEKLNMKGEPVNINNIGKSIENELSDLGQRMSGKSGQVNQVANRAANGIGRFFQALAEVLKALLNGLGKVLGSLFLIAGMFAIIGILAAFFGVADFFHWGSEQWHNSMSIYEFGDMVFESNDWFASAIIGLILTISIPFIALAYGGFSLLFPGYRVPYLGASLMAAWFIGIAITIFTAFGVAREFSKTDTVKAEISIIDNDLEGDTISVDLGIDPFNISTNRAYRENRNDFIMKSVDGKILFGNVSFTIEKSQHEGAYLEVLKSAQGKTVEDAREKSERIIYNAQVDSNRLVLDAFYSFPKEDLLRAQDLNLVLRLPEGKAVRLNETTRRIIDDIDNVQNIYDPDMVGHTWIMTTRGLSCVDCVDENGRSTGEIHTVDGEEFNAKIVIENN